MTRNLILSGILLWFYGDAQPTEQMLFLAELATLYHATSYPCLIGGDFNLIRKPEENGS